MSQQVPAGPLTRLFEGTATPPAAAQTWPAFNFAGGMVDDPAPAGLANRVARQLSLDPTGALRVNIVAGGSTLPDAVHVSFTEGGTLAGGASSVTFYTVTAGRHARLESVIAAYTGTTQGVTMQLLAGGVAVWLPIGGLATGQFVALMPAGLVIPADAAETFQVALVGATANDDLDVRAHVTETA